MMRFNWTMAEVITAAALAASVGIFVYQAVYLPPSKAEFLAKLFSVERVYDGKGGERQYCTKFKPYPDEPVIVSAEHCHRAVSLSHETSIVAPREIDGALYDGTLPFQARRMIEGETVYILGYPGRARSVELVTATVYFRRTQQGASLYSVPTTIIEAVSPLEPFMEGMSGGVVLSADYEPLGILVGRAESDLDGDGEPNYTGEVTELHDLWAIQP